MSFALKALIFSAVVIGDLIAIAVIALKSDDHRDPQQRMILLSALASGSVVTVAVLAWFLFVMME